MDPQILWIFSRKGPERCQVLRDGFCLTFSPLARSDKQYINKHVYRYSLQMLSAEGLQSRQRLATQRVAPVGAVCNVSSNCTQQMLPQLVACARHFTQLWRRHPSPSVSAGRHTCSNTHAHPRSPTLTCRNVATEPTLATTRRSILTGGALIAQHHSRCHDHAAAVAAALTAPRALTTSSWFRRLLETSRRPTLCPGALQPAKLQCGVRVFKPTPRVRWR